MNSNFHYLIDLNEDQNNQPFFCPLGLSIHQASSSSSSSSSSLSYLPTVINSQQEHIGYHNTTDFNGDHDHLSQTLEAKMLVPNGGSSCDHMVPKKETRMKLTIRKKEERTDLPLQNQTKQDQSDSSQAPVKWMSSKNRLMKKMMITDKEPMDQDVREDDRVKKTSPDHSTVFDNGYSDNNNNGVIRVCSDCNTTKTPLWRSGPRGPKSLCNACGIRQRKARRAAMAAAAGAQDSPAAQPPPAKKKKMHKKNKRSIDHYKAKKLKIAAMDSDTQSKSWPSSSSSSPSNRFGFDDLTIILSKSSAFHQVFPQDEKEAAILLMALSYGMVNG